MNLPAPDPAHFWQWLLSAALLIWLLKLCLDLYRTHFKISPPLHKEYTTIKQHSELSRRVDGVQDEARTGDAMLLNKIEQFDKERRNSVSRSYDFARKELGKAFDKMAENGERIAAVTKQGEIHQIQMSQIEGKLDRLILQRKEGK